MPRLRSVLSTPAPLHPAVLSANSSGFQKKLIELGAWVASLAALGSVVGLVLAAFTKTFKPQANVEYDEWIAYSGALFGLFALCFQIAVLISD